MGVFPNGGVWKVWKFKLFENWSVLTTHRQILQATQCEASLSTETKKHAFLCCMSPCTNDHYQRRAQTYHYQRRAGATEWGGANKSSTVNTE
jgi:hypothetical protein